MLFYSDSYPDPWIRFRIIKVGSGSPWRDTNLVPGHILGRDGRAFLAFKEHGNANFLQKCGTWKNTKNRNANFGFLRRMFTFTRPTSLYACTVCGAARNSSRLWGGGGERRGWGLLRDDRLQCSPHIPPPQHILFTGWTPASGQGTCSGHDKDCSPSLKMGAEFTSLEFPSRGAPRVHPQVFQGYPKLTVI